MSCDGWSVGDRCRARVAFQTRLIGGPRGLRQIYVGDEGIVRRKLPEVHMLSVWWNRLNETLIVSHDQVHLLDKIS